jgi:hypothetical protein
METLMVLFAFFGIYNLQYFGTVKSVSGKTQMNADLLAVYKNRQQLPL